MATVLDLEKLKAEIEEQFPEPKYLATKHKVRNHIREILDCIEDYKYSTTELNFMIQMATTHVDKWTENQERWISDIVLKSVYRLKNR